MRRPTVGVFDSGFGGLTVLKALLELIPGADYVYFGDTARLPYGSKSAETVARYAVEAAHYLESQDAQTSESAICGTAFGETNDTASMCLNPTLINALM
jgi:glutamate racemase